MIFLIEYWRELTMASMAIILAFVLSYYPNRVKALEGERNVFEMALEFQNDALLKDKEEYERKLAKLPKEIEKIKIRYKVIYESIDNWEGDVNATDCENASKFLNSVNY